MPDAERTRSGKTRERLLRSAERLFAARGVENVTVRSIVLGAGQKNESALNYHFVNRAGLVRAIHIQRNTQTQKLRSVMLDDLLSQTASPPLREICRVMVTPPFLLARKDAGYRQYIRAFSESAATSTPFAVEAPVTTAERAAILRGLLRALLMHLDDDMFEQRVQAAVRFVRLWMSVQARRPSAFRGVQSEVALNILIDAMAGLLSAPVSEETRAALSLAQGREGPAPRAGHGRKVRCA